LKIEILKIRISLLSRISLHLINSTDLKCFVRYQQLYNYYFLVSSLFLLFCFFSFVSLSGPSIRIQEFNLQQWREDKGLDVVWQLLMKESEAWCSVTNIIKHFWSYRHYCPFSVIIPVISLSRYKTEGSIKTAISKIICLFLISGLPYVISCISPAFGRCTSWPYQDMTESKRENASGRMKES
jgi:hypothetical protein